jgi:hypothetical protein
MITRDRAAVPYGEDFNRTVCRGFHAGLTRMLRTPPRHGSFVIREPVVTERMRLSSGPNLDFKAGQSNNFWLTLTLPFHVMARLDRATALNIVLMPVARSGRAPVDRFASRDDKNVPS